ncbi:SIMPL domain-containing protein [Streptomyces sp. NPDC005731]|uniref:SIMPL domain-containing protein n=1 Tax=unclassified Streptomyces TaxID=2593676 RepID=UPI00340A4D15
MHAYHGHVHLSAELNDFTALGELTTRLADLELTRVDGPWRALRPDSPTHRAARQQAVREAVQRAREYAETLGTPSRPWSNSTTPAPTTPIGAAAPPGPSAGRLLTARKPRAAPTPSRPNPGAGTSTPGSTPGSRWRHRDSRQFPSPAVTRIHGLPEIDPCISLRDAHRSAAPHNSTLVNIASLKGC